MARYKDFTKRKKKSFQFFFLKNDSRLSLFPDFFQAWKIAGQISALFQELKTLYEPCKE